jgi:O-antigen/teichoic acid export membrane protein
VRRNVLRAVQLVSLICFPAFFGMAAVAGDLVPVVLGERWAQLVVPFQLLCLVLPLKAVAAIFSPAVCGIGRPDIDVWNMTLALILMTVALLVGVQYGVTGICLAWVIAYPVAFLAMAWRSGRALSTSIADFLSRCAFPAVSSALMALFVAGLRVALTPLGVSALRLGLLIAAGAAAYGASVLLFQRSTLRELIAVVRS